jgi:hypothetical protein
MTEAGGLIVAAIIAGVVAIIAAIITGVVSFLSLITSKEQSVSEHRQQWIDALRKDIAIIVGRVTAIHGESIVKHKDGQDELWARLKGELTGFNRVIVRIRLRLNRKEKGEKEGPATKAVLDTLEKLKSIFASPQPQFHELDGLVNTLVDNSQVILKENWNRVRDGEPIYQKAKRNTWIAVKIFASLGVVAVILSVLHWFRVM